MFWTWCGRERKKKISKRFQFTRFFFPFALLFPAWRLLATATPVQASRMNRQAGGTQWRVVWCEVQSEISWWVVLISGDEGPFQPLDADWLTFFPVFLGVLWGTW